MAEGTSGKGSDSVHILIALSRDEVELCLPPPAWAHDPVQWLARQRGLAVGEPYSIAYEGEMLFLRQEVPRERLPVFWTQGRWHALEELVQS